MEEDAPGPGGSFVRSLLFMLILSIVVLFGYMYVQSKGGISNVIGGNNTSVPEEFTINYVPADFKPELPDDGTIMAIVANPYRYAHEFDDLVKNLNLSLLVHVSNRMNLPDSLRSKIIQEYDQHHPYLKKLYFNDFVALQDSTSALYEQWYNAENQNAVDLLEEITGKYTCFLVNQVITSVLKTNGGTMSIKGSAVNTPCGVAMAEGLQPMIKRLKEEAAVKDFSNSKGFLEERVENAIAELATMEVTERKGLTRSMKTKVLGMEVSSTDIEISAISILKVGFDLQKYFDVSLDSDKKRVTVTLPDPQILSHEVYPSIDKLDVGWMREIAESDFNENFNLLRREFRKTAYTAEIEQEAKAKAAELMKTMLTPMVQNLDKRYKLVIRFQQLNSDPFDTPVDRPADRVESIKFEG
ncbi:MAG: hypothetical protein ACI85O_001904 [Saprospiraceae bacterium]|jgi:hypothetical protein